MIRFSIIVPVYNMGNILSVSINSLLSQSFEDYEVIIVNDGSLDNTDEVCQQLSKQHERIVYIKTDNRGSGPARNTGIEVSRGEYLFFPDADDVVAPDALQRLNKIIENDKHDLVVFGYKKFNSKGKLMSVKKYSDTVFDGERIRSSYYDFFSMDSVFGIQGAPWNKLFKASVIKDNKLSFPALRRHQDDAFIGSFMTYVKDVRFSSCVLYTIPFPTEKASPKKIISTFFVIYF